MSALEGRRMKLIPSRPGPILSLVALCAGTIAAYGQTILRVDADAPAGGNGATWETAYRDLQAALQAAIPLTATGPVELWVAAGTYRPDSGGNRASHFELRNKIGIYGGFIGIETLRSQRNPNPLENGTALSGDLLANDVPGFVNRGDNCYNVVYALGADGTATLDGFA